MLPKKTFHCRISICLVAMGFFVSSVDAAAKNRQLIAAVKRHKVDDSEKQLRWEYYRHYSTVHDVMVDPERFHVAPEALRPKR